ncbi:uncharacterized protein LOC108150931 [Drosophila miranda]|uniref:uncharacterized protein LOC108150931 n=1 Tax=Drosophila miranda TaxID=7229 RepID=UPI0007E7A3BA|nr:uncharacterized protein LOC108150931 [Drosophila miranda]XP_026846007.1 uncharacterized protein LOC113566112 [Drosophila persimilis]
MSGQVVVTLVAALCVLLPMAWCMPSQISRQEATTTTSARREIIKDFVARVQALIIELMEKLKALSALG